MKTAASATGEGYDSSGATAATPTPTRRDGGHATASEGSISGGEQIVNIPSYADTLRQLAEQPPASYADALREIQQRSARQDTLYSDELRKLLEELGGYREP